MDPAADHRKVTVLYDGRTTTVTAPLLQEEDLWLTPAALDQVSGFVLKPEGACLGELCVPIHGSPHQAVVREGSEGTFVNLSALARVLNQPTIHDPTHAVWVFGARPDARRRVLETLEAPTFTLPDWRGALRSLTEFRGRKVLLVTWASW